MRIAEINVYQVDLPSMMVPANRPAASRRSTSPAGICWGRSPGCRWGGDIDIAAISHLAHSMPTDFLFASTDFNSDVTRSIATGAPQRQNGRLAASTGPGLGRSPRLDVLGEPVWSC